MSISFMTPGHAQTEAQAPSAGDLPPEFMQETQPSAGGAIPPPPAEPPAPAPGAPAPPQTQDVPPSAAPSVTTDPSLIPTDVPVAIVPHFASDEEYNYDPTGRRDPFRPYRSYRPSPSIQGSNAPQIDLADPLQRWDLDRFAVVAIMWEVRQPKAMVRDPDGKLYMIGKKTKIGRNGGHVVTIREGEVVIVEAIDNEGVITNEVKVLELKK